MGAHGYPVKTITKYLAGVRAWMTESGMRQEWEAIKEDPVFKDMENAIKKVQGHLGLNKAPRRKPALTVGDIEVLSRAPQRADYDHALFMAIVTTGFFGLCRLGELVWPDDVWLQSPLKIPARSSLELGPTSLPGDHRASANRAFGHGMQAWDIMIDYAAWRDLLHKDNHKDFLFLRKDGSVPTRKWFIQKLKALAGSQFAGHSLQSGGATWLARQGASVIQLMRAGCWKSDVFLSYIRANLSLGEALQATEAWNGGPIIG
ncbi:hypothetical protein DFS34DRAFT_671795 [Phlyctochytrium arcticum]|nr:hypothetical protein DFS34DRAFT_678108 [Phlyctochytrium arcticum]KAI9103379.1 hypothetical protein DFS34DRAFT_671795 [Phlyctochytrium arcticum]